MIFLPVCIKRIPVKCKWKAHIYTSTGPENNWRMDTMDFYIRKEHTMFSDKETFFCIQ